VEVNWNLCGPTPYLCSTTLYVCVRRCVRVCPHMSAYVRMRLHVCVSVCLCSFACVLVACVCLLEMTWVARCATSTTSMPNRRCRTEPAPASTPPFCQRCQRFAPAPDRDRVGIGIGIGIGIAGDIACLPAFCASTGQHSSLLPAFCASVLCQHRIGIGMIACSASTGQRCQSARAASDASLLSFLSLSPLSLGSPPSQLLFPEIVCMESSSSSLSSTSLLSYPFILLAKMAVKMASYKLLSKK